MLQAHTIISSTSISIIRISSISDIIIISLVIIIISLVIIIISLVIIIISLIIIFAFIC